MMAEKIRILAIKRKVTISELASLIGTSQANLGNKLRRDNFSEKELREIASALNCRLDIDFTLNDTNEKI